MTESTAERVGPGARITTSNETTARVDVSRCALAGASEDLRGAAWIAVVGTRDEVASDAARKMAERYWLMNQQGGIERSYGPIPDGPEVVAPPDPAHLSPAQMVVDRDTYLQRAARANTTKSGDKCVCFHLVRPLWQA